VALVHILAASAGCGVSERSTQTEEPAEAVETPATHFSWPSGERPVAVLQIRNMGEVRIALYPELAPQTVDNFLKLVREDFYTGTTFHRVIPGFAIQGGSPGSRDDDPHNDSHGDPGYTIADEFNDAPHLRGVVSMANMGKKDTGANQFFIVHQDSRYLDGHYAAFGRVIEGMDVVDAVTQVEIDKAGRWGSPDRPVENVVIEQIRIEAATDAHAQDDRPARARGNGSA
jgi:peptidyl-prolyl cis-trans isomerase B (cyclophilin B)